MSTNRPAPARFSVNVRDLRDVNPGPATFAALVELGATVERVFTSAYGPHGDGWKQQLMVTNGGGASLVEVRAALALALSTEVEVKVAALAPTAKERRAVEAAAVEAAAVVDDVPVDELDDDELAREIGLARDAVARAALTRSAIRLDAANARLAVLVDEVDGRAPAPTYVRVALADALPGDEVFQGGEWTPVASFHVFGSRRDLVKIIWPNGGSMAMPASHCPTIRRAVEAAPMSDRHPAVDLPAMYEGPRVPTSYTAAGRCPRHPAFDADYCPTCGTTTPIGDRDQVTR